MTDIIKWRHNGVFCVCCAGLQEKDVLCDLCGHAFSTRSLMQRHRRLIHDDAYRGRYRCPHCAYYTYSRPNMKRHVLCVHKDLPTHDLDAETFEGSAG